MRQNVKLVYSQLIETLEEMVKSYRFLLDLVRQEKEILIASNLEKLNESNFAKDSVLNKINDLEAVRVTQASQLCAQLGLDAESPRLLDIAVAVGGDEAENLRSMHSVLDLLIKRIKDFNKTNESLAEAALKTLQGSIEAVRDNLHGKKIVYQNKGNMRERANQLGAFVSKEA